MKPTIPFLHDTVRNAGGTTNTRAHSTLNSSEDFGKILRETYFMPPSAFNELGFSVSKARTGYQSDNNLQGLHSSTQATATDSSPASSIPGVQRQQFDTVFVGELSEDNPTVSHLLKAHPDLNEETWNIIYAKINKDKIFNNLPVGTAVHFHPETRELTWGSNDFRVIEEDPPRLLAEGSEKSSGVVSHDAPIDQVNKGIGAMANLPVSLGVIDQSNPTVSHLLHHNKEFSSKLWELVSSDINRNKPFHQISTGTEIFIHPHTMEITWGKPVHNEKSPVVVGQQNNEPENAPLDLTEAVQPLMGKNYEDIDCYELLVAGLRRLDIPYGGKNGLYSRLTSMAKDNGLSVNAYLNGEGIVKAAGSTLLEKRIPAPTDWRQEAERFYHELEPMLKKGQILSFSTRSRGHTGIISQQQDQWTFINSGRLDNSVSNDTPTKGVGEEDLQQEIGNWFKLAHKNSQSLSVTLGQIEQEKVLAGVSQSTTFSGQI